MKIAAFSDTHGCLMLDGCIDLPNIKEGTEVVCIAGDIVPLDHQSNENGTKYWLTNRFFPWVKELKVEKVIFIGGNHDRWFEKWGKEQIREFIKEAELEDKLIYLMDDAYEYDGKKFFGSPWIINLHNWAFYTPDPEKQFSVIEDCDVLITHLPPRHNGVGCSYPNQLYMREYGCIELKNVIESHKISVNLCGHIHSGIHYGVQLGDTMIYNVSMLNESYAEAYEVTYFEI